MACLERFTLLLWNDPSHYALVQRIEWPAGLTHLTVRTDADLEGVDRPPRASLLFDPNAREW